MSEEAFETILDPDGDLWVTVHKTVPPEGSSDGHQSNNPSEKDRRLITEGLRKTHKIKVCSHLLTTASPVFKKMLTGWCKEANDFKASKAHASSSAVSSLYTLDLPEDDADATFILFKVLHHKTIQPRALHDATLLDNLTFLCDKYLCTGAVRFHAIVWIREKIDNLQKWVHSSKHTEAEWNNQLEGLTKLLVMAYVFEVPKMFSHLAGCLILLRREPFSSKDSGTALLINHPLLGESDAARVVSHLDLKFLELSKRYHQDLMTPLSTAWKSSGTDQDCGAVSKALAKYLKFLRDQRILPYDFYLPNRRLLDLLTLKYPVFKVEPCDRGVLCPGCRADGNLPIARDLALKLRAAATQINEMSRQLVCLMCVKPQMSHHAKWDMTQYESWGCDRCRPTEQEPFTE